MTTEKLHDRARLFGVGYLKNYARSRRAAAWVFAALFFLFLGAAQFLTYGIALREEYPWKNAVVLAAVPFVGPVVLGVQCVMADGMDNLRRALLLLGAVAPSVLFLLLGAHFHDLRKRALCVQAEREEDALLRAEPVDRLSPPPALPGQPPVILRPGAGPVPVLKREAASGAVQTVSGAMPAAVPTRAEAVPVQLAKSVPPAEPSEASASKDGASAVPDTLPEKAPAARTAALPVSQMGGKARTVEIPAAEAYPAGAARSSVSGTAGLTAATSSHSSTSSGVSRPSPALSVKSVSPASSGDASLQKAEEEYKRAMQDVWALLQKKDK